VYRNEENFTSGKHRARIQMDVVTSTVKSDAASARRFTIDDGAMLVYFRCAEQAQRDFWIKALSDASSAGHKTDDYTLRRRERSTHLQPVGDFMLGDLVGEGGYAKVKSGFSVKTGERVAAKIMLSSQRDEHKSEILTMSALKHPNIVELKDVIEAGGHTYLIMELAKGGELFAKLCEIGRFTEDEARFYWKQLLQGVLYCHRKGLCHRDLKLENLLLDEKGEVLKITDFGFAKFQVDSMPKTILGTAVYVAPEVLESSPTGYDGYLADVWSCGVILYTMIVGNYPFDLGYHGGVGKGNRRNPAIYELLTKAQYRLPSCAALCNLVLSLVVSTRQHSERLSRVCL
jgi:serine/threonine-protein kinase SRK2